MPNDLQLFENRCRIQTEVTAGDSGDDNNVLEARLTGSSFVRDIAESQERMDPFRAREFTDVVHQAWGVEIRGNLRTGGFVAWILEQLTEENGTERSLRVLELRPEGSATVPTFAIQFEGIEGTATFLGCALRKIAFHFQGRRKVGYTAEFVALEITRSEGTWATDAIEAGEILTTSNARLALAGALGGDPVANQVTGYEGTIEIVRPDLEAAQFSPDGKAGAHSNAGNWDVVGRLLLPEISGITDTGLEAEWNGEVNLAAISIDGSDVLEIEAPITGLIDRRQTQANDWKQAQLDFVSRRSDLMAIARFLTNHTVLAIAYWILTGGIWNDGGTWIDGAVWED